MPKSDFDFSLKVVTFGNSCVGKTSFLYRYIEGVNIKDLKATCFMELRTKRVVYTHKGQAKNISLELWDTAGQERFRSITSSYYRNAVGYLLLFDVTNVTTFTNISYWLNEIRTNAYCENPEIIIIGNKCELTGERVVTHSQGRRFAEQQNIAYIEVSSATGQNVDEAFNVLIGKIMTRMDDPEAAQEMPVKTNQTMNVNEESPVTLTNSSQFNSGNRVNVNVKCC